MEGGHDQIARCIAMTVSRDEGSKMSDGHHQHVTVTQFIGKCVLWVT